MRNPIPLTRLTLALASLALAGATQAQTILKFSHTDQQVRARQQPPDHHLQKLRRLFLP